MRLLEKWLFCSKYGDTHYDKQHMVYIVYMVYWKKAKVYSASMVRPYMTTHISATNLNHYSPDKLEHFNVAPLHHTTLRSLRGEVISWFKGFCVQLKAELAKAAALKAAGSAKPGLTFLQEAKDFPLKLPQRHQEANEPEGLW